MIGKLFLLFILSFIHLGAANSFPCYYYDSVDITGAFIDEKQSAIIRGKEFPNGSYGYFNETGEPTHLRGCFCHLVGAKPCLRFCCKVGFVKISEVDDRCYSYKNEIYVHTSNSENSEKIQADENFRMIKRGDCPVYEHRFLDDEKWTILENGSIDFFRDPTYIYGDYCLDVILMENTRYFKTRASICFEYGEDHKSTNLSIIHSEEYGEDHSSINLSIFHGENHGDYSSFHITHTYSLLGIMSSIIFLIITLLIYVSIPSLRNLRGKLLMCYMAAIIVFYLFLVLGKTQFSLRIILLCTILEFLAFGSSLLVIFFLNAISIDYFSAFFMESFRLKHKLKLFGWYWKYSVGASLVLLIVAVIYQAYELGPNEWMPRVGPDNCIDQSFWIGKSIFFYLLVTLTVSINLFLFLSTACKMRNIRKERAMVKEEQKIFNHEWERETFCHLCLLFLFVDFSWLTEVFLMVMQAPYGGQHYIIHFFEFFGYSQGIWIFIFCILRSSTFELIRLRSEINNRCPNIKYERAAEGEITIESTGA